MNFKRYGVLILAILCCVMLVACSSNANETASADSISKEEYEALSKELEEISKQLDALSEARETMPAETEAVPETTAAPKETEPESDDEFIYLAADWADEPYKRNGCTTYPLVLDDPIENCKGFTVDYFVTDVTDGKMKSDSKFQIFYKTSGGDWVKGKTFTLDDGDASVEQTIKKSVTVTQVAVLCLNSGNFSWSVSMGIRNPVY